MWAPQRSRARFPGARQEQRRGPQRWAPATRARRCSEGWEGGVLEALADRNWITAAGIRSTGLTGALGIARHAAELYRRDFGELRERTAPAITVPNLAEHLPRRNATPGYGEMVCHCELVTRVEIEDALAGPLPAADLGGLKRRTRVMMGRCQGFYCSAKVAALAAGRLAGFPPGGGA